jgi:hypothetical protein
MHQSRHPRDVILIMTPAGSPTKEAKSRYDRSTTITPNRTIISLSRKGAYRLPQSVPYPYLSWDRRPTGTCLKRPRKSQQITKRLPHSPSSCAARCRLHLERAGLLRSGRKAKAGTLKLKSGNYPSSGEVKIVYVKQELFFFSTIDRTL